MANINTVIGTTIDELNDLGVINTDVIDTVNPQDLSELLCFVLFGN